MEQEGEMEDRKDEMSNLSLLTRIKKQDVVIAALITLILALYETL